MKLETCIRCKRKYKRWAVVARIEAVGAISPFYYTVLIPDALCKKCYQEFREFWTAKKQQPETSK